MQSQSTAPTFLDRLASLFGFGIVAIDSDVPPHRVAVTEPIALLPASIHHHVDVAARDTELVPTLTQEQLQQARSHHFAYHAPAAKMRVMVLIRNAVLSYVEKHHTVPTHVIVSQNRYKQYCKTLPRASMTYPAYYYQGRRVLVLSDVMLGYPLVDTVVICKD